MKKRIFIAVACVVLALLIVLGCLLFSSDNKEPTFVDGLTPGTYDSSHPQFAQLREYYFDYFWEMYGVQNLTSNKDGKYNDEDAISFAFTYLSRGLGVSINEGVTKEQLNEVTNKYLGHTITDFDTDVSMLNTANNTVYLTKFINDYFGDLFVLQELVVQKDGTHQASFHRCDLPEHFWENPDVSDPFKKILNGEYSVFGNDIYVTPTRVVFDVLLDEETEKQYLKVSVIKEQIR